MMQGLNSYLSHFENLALSPRSARVVQHAVEELLAVRVPRLIRDAQGLLGRVQVRAFRVADVREVIVEPWPELLEARVAGCCCLLHQEERCRQPD